LNEFIGIVGLSIGISLAATFFATMIGLPLGAALAIFPFRGNRAVVVLTNAFFGLPPVVVGLVLYLALSYSGPLGFLHLLFTPSAMIIGPRKISRAQGFQYRRTTQAGCSGLPARSPITT